MAGVIGAGIPTVAYITGIRMLGPSRAAILATLEPVIGVLLAAWLLAEQPTPIQIVGGALILAAAVLLQLRSRTASRARSGRLTLSFVVRGGTSLLTGPADTAQQATPPHSRRYYPAMGPSATFGTGRAEPRAIHTRRER